MATKKNTSLALFLLLNLIFFSLTSASTYRSPKPCSPAIPYLGTLPSPYPGTPPATPPSPQPSLPPSPQPGNSCPRDALKLGLCASVLGDLLNVTIGTPTVTPCCSLIDGLVDLEAAVCLCTTIRASILGLNVNLHIFLTLLLNVCSREVPRDFICA